MKLELEFYRYLNLKGFMIQCLMYGPKGPKRSK